MRHDPLLAMSKPFSYSRATSPLLLSTDVSLVNGASAVPDLAQLSSPFREPILIDEVRFIITSPLTTVTQATGDFSLDFGAAIQCRFRVGRVEISEGHVPVWLYGTSMQQHNTTVEVVTDTPGVQVEVVQTFAHYRWKLPVPLLVPSGSVLIPNFRRIDGAGFTFPGAANVNISYAGRYVDPGLPLPKLIQVPWVSAFAPTMPVAFYKTGERELSNILDVPVRVQRFTGRIFAQIGVGIDTQVLEATDNGTSTPGGFMVGMKDSYGREVIKDLTPFSSVFDEQRRAWTFDKILGPREQYVMTIYNGLVDPDVAMVPQVALIGWREEVFR